MEFSGEAKREFRESAYSEKLKRDMEYLRKNRMNPFLVGGNVNLDKYVQFLDEFNAFVGHQRRSFRKILDVDMKI